MAVMNRSKMEIKDIKKLIASDESQTLELKKTTGELKDGMHSACAFLNTEGGWLIFGVAPKSLKIIGQEVTDKTQQEIAQALAGLEPAVDVRVVYVDVPEYPGNKVITMHFDGWVWGERPHTFHGCPYYKVESTTKVMPQDMYDERIRAHQPQIYAWERLAADGVTLTDLDEKLVRNCIRRGIDGGVFLKLHCMSQSGIFFQNGSCLRMGFRPMVQFCSFPTTLTNIHSSL